MNNCEVVLARCREDIVVEGDKEPSFYKNKTYVFCGDGKKYVTYNELNEPHIMMDYHMAEMFEVIERDKLYRQ